MDDLKEELAINKGVQDSDEIRLLDYPTTDAEAAALNSFMENSKTDLEWSMYDVTGFTDGGVDCRSFTREGLQSAGLNKISSAARMLTPNLLFDLLTSENQDSSATREKVTHRLCDENDQNCH